MIASVPDNQHAAEFEAQFGQIFAELGRIARSKGIAGCYAAGGSPNPEDPEDFAQECLIEYWNRALQRGYRNVQTGLIKRIARDRLVDAWRKRDRDAKREEFEACTNELTESAGSIDKDGESAWDEFRGLSDTAVDILRLKHVAQWLDREIAVALGMTVNGVRSSLKRSHKRILAERGTHLAPTVVDISTINLTGIEA